MTPERAIALLRKYASDPQSFDIVLRHSKRTAEIALRYAKHIPDIDLNFIECASLLHDIGRFECPPNSPRSIQHGIVGATILRKEGVEERYALVCEHHTGAGISKEDIKEQKLNLPMRDFLPTTKEEKIIAFADKLGKADHEWTLQEVLKRYAQG